LSATILWALLQANRDSFRISTRTFDERFGSRVVREAIFAGTDPDVAFDGQRAAVERFSRAAQRFHLYH
jgi:hypothetical protein